MRRPSCTAGTYAATGGTTSGTDRPSSARRSSTALMSGLLPLQVGDEVATVTGQDLHELPAVLAPLVEDLLGRVHDQRHGRVLPLALAHASQPSHRWQDGRHGP